MQFLALPLTQWLQDLLRKWLISKQLRLYGIQEVTGSIPVSSTEITQHFFRKQRFWVHGCILGANSVVHPSPELGVKRPTSSLIAFRHVKRSHESGWARDSDRAS